MTLVPGCINPSKINVDITVQSHISYPIINHKCDLSSHIYMAAILQASAAVEVTATSATLYSQRPSTSVAKNWDSYTLLPCTVTTATYQLYR